MNKTGISWCNYTWGIVHGCTKTSDGCKNCYADVMAKRLAGTGVKGYDPADPFKVMFCLEKLEEPIKVKKPSNIFVASMGDLFHELITTDQLRQVFRTVQDCPWHNFLVLTKRSSRLRAMHSYSKLPNLWLGVTVENNKHLDRIDDLIATGHENLFVSLEPLLGPIDITPYLPALKWVIVGAESGPGKRPCYREWVSSIIGQCQTAGVPVFYKQGPGDGVLWCKEPIMCGQQWLQFPEGLQR